MSENGPPEIRTNGSDQEYWSSIDTAVATLRERASDESTLALLCRLAADHAERPVRAAALNLLAERFADQPAAQETTATATADSVDWVGFTAAKIAGRNRIRPAVENLIRISGWPSNTAPTHLCRNRRVSRSRVFLICGPDACARTPGAGKEVE